MTRNQYHNDFEDKLINILTSSEVDGKFSFPIFFSKWFRKFGTSYFFLFKKNLKVTNIQFAELLALIRTHTVPKAEEGNEPILDLQFLSVSEFKTAICEIINAFPRVGSKSNGFHYDIIVKLYSSLLRRIMVIDSFFGSCVVFIPPHLTVDLLSICAYSGYIHSCGYNVFIRKVYKTKREDFFSAIDKHLKRYLEKGKRAFFSVYAHEDFTKCDREQASELRYGLDDVKIFVEKFYMGSYQLVAILKEMKEKFKKTLEIPDSGNDKTSQEKFRRQPNADTSRTLWLIIDYSIGKESRHPGEARYFICYDQLYINESPFHLFDENKPAWISHTTIPHTLIGAMINITKPWWPSNGKVSLADPFVGTGTTWLEALKYSNVSVECGDIEPITPLIAADNVTFFCASLDDLKMFEIILQADPTSEDNNRAKRPYMWAVKFLARLLKPEDSHSNKIPNISKQIVKILKSKTLFDRLLFYIALRTYQRNIFAFRRESIDWTSAYRMEAKVLAGQLKNLYELKLREQNKSDQKGTISIFQGNYSLSCSIGFDSLVRFHDEKKVCSIIKIQDARQLKEKSYDVIVTDPPYGFNTDDDPKELAKLYADVIKAMIFALKDDGQLVLCLPDWSHTGRQVPYFTRKEFITQQVLAMAEQAKREVINSAYAVPPPSEIFRAPFYWESERALRRAILHFRIRTRQ